MPLGKFQYLIDKVLGDNLYWRQLSFKILPHENSIRQPWKRIPWTTLPALGVTYHQKLHFSWTLTHKTLLDSLYERPAPSENILFYCPQKFYSLGGKKKQLKTHLRQETYVKYLPSGHAISKDLLGCVLPQTVWSLRSTHSILFLR